MNYPIVVIVRDRYGAYQCRMPNGTRASSTHSPEVAVERAMDKCWEPGTHRATRTGRDVGVCAVEFEINPIEGV
jgi:hypothetical protein